MHRDRADGVRTRPGRPPPPAAAAATDAAIINYDEPIFGGFAAYRCYYGRGGYTTEYCNALPLREGLGRRQGSACYVSCTNTFVHNACHVLICGPILGQGELKVLKRPNVMSGGRKNPGPKTSFTVSIYYRQENVLHGSDPG